MFALNSRCIQRTFCQRNLGQLLHGDVEERLEIQDARRCGASPPTLNPNFLQQNIPLAYQVSCRLVVVFFFFTLCACNHLLPVPLPISSNLHSCCTKLLSTRDRLPYDLFIIFSTFTAIFVRVYKEHHKEIVYFFIFCWFTVVLLEFCSLGLPCRGEVEDFCWRFLSLFKASVFSMLVTRRKSVHLQERCSV